MENKMKRKMPTILKVLAILTYIGAGLTFLMAFGLIIAGSFVASFISEFDAINALGGAFFVGSGIFLIGMAVLQIFIARGYYKSQNWAKTITIIFSAIGAVGAFIGLITGDFSSIVSLVINGLIFYYFMFNEECKTWFLY